MQQKYHFSALVHMVIVQDDEDLYVYAIEAAKVAFFCFDALGDRSASQKSILRDHRRGQRLTTLPQWTGLFISFLEMHMASVLQR